MKYKFSKLDNFRDLGDIAAAGGKKVRPGRLLRCGEMSNLTEEDTRLLKYEFHVVNVVDLRTENERKLSPDCVIPGACHLSLDFFPGEASKKADCSEEQLGKMQSASQQHQNMIVSYTSFIMDSHVRKALYEFLQLLLRTEEGATLFHCYAGKDRTGITAAVILTVLGVPKSSIIKDYMETNVMRKEVNRTILDYLQKAGQPENVLEAVNAGLCVEQEYLDTAYKTAEQQYGSFENYISQGIGLEESDWGRLRTIYLE